MRMLRWMGTLVVLLLVGSVGAVGVGTYQTERDITAFQNRIAAIAEMRPAPQPTNVQLSTLPAPVQRYFDFVFPKGIVKAQVVRVTAQGQFRRPQTETFSFTTAEQVIAIGEPALVFSATTPIVTGIWARAYDFFANGEMEMKAKVLSLFTVVDEAETPELNQISLRRWLLESALFPQALLPGGPVSWEAIDQHSARAIVTANGQRATMVAHFDKQGRMTHMVAEEDGDLLTPYHGSGEHVARSDYRDVGGVMIPHRLIISRASDGQIFPFFDAEITDISFE